MQNLLSLNSYHYRRGGSDAVYFDHARIFEDAGWRNTFFSMHHPNNIDCQDSKYFASIVDWEHSKGHLARAKAGIRSIYNLDARSKIKKLIRDRRPDIAHVHCIYHHLTPAVLPVLSAAGIPIVLTAHDLKIACPAYKMMNSGGICEKCKSGSLWNVLANRCIKESFVASAIVGTEAYLHAMLGSYRNHLTRIVAPSRFYREKLIEWGWEADRISYVPNFVQPANERFSGDYCGNILYFGRLSEEKGLATLVRASAISGVAVDIVGDGPQREFLIELINRTNAPARLLGRLDGAELWSKVGKSRAVVLPSEWYENAPMSALEAMQLARPVIGADIGGIPELISDSGAGILFASRSVDGLALALSEAMDIGSKALGDMGKTASEYVATQFSRDQYLTRMQSVYSECVL